MSYGAAESVVVEAQLVVGFGILAACEEEFAAELGIAFAAPSGGECIGGEAFEVAVGEVESAPVDIVARDVVGIAWDMAGVAEVGAGLEAEEGVGGGVVARGEGLDGEAGDGVVGEAGITQCLADIVFGGGVASGVEDVAHIAVAASGAAVVAIGEEEGEGFAVLREGEVVEHIVLEDSALHVVDHAGVVVGGVEGGDAVFGFFEAEHGLLVAGGHEVGDALEIEGLCEEALVATVGKIRHDAGHDGVRGEGFAEAEAGVLVEIEPIDPVVGGE